MSAASNYLENKVLDHVLRYSTAPYTGVSTLYLALFNNTSTNAASNLESGTLTDETSTSSATVTFDTATANWGTITHVAVMDGATAGAGNVLFYGAVTTSKTIETGDTFQVSSGNLTVSLA